MNTLKLIGKICLFVYICLVFFTTDAVAITGSSWRILPATEVRALYPSEWQVDYVRGVAFNWELEHIFLIDQAQEAADRTQVVTITPFEDGISNVDIPFVMDDVINVTFDQHSRRLLLLNNDRQQLAYVSLGADDILDPASLVQIDVSSWNITKAQGLAIDNAGEALYVLDSSESRVVRIALNGGSAFAGGAVSTMDLSALDATLQGIAFLDLKQHLYVGDPASQLVYELTKSARLVQTHSVAGIGLTEVGGMAFGPSADRTDPPEVAHLFIADSKLPTTTLGTVEGATDKLDRKVYLPMIGTTIAGTNIAVGTQQSLAPVGTTALQILYGSLSEVALCAPSCSSASWLVTRRVAASADDAEERIPTGDMSELTSTDLELIREAQTDQLVGIRFQDLPIPSDAQIQYVAIEFAVDEAEEMPTDLLFQGEATDHAAAFTLDDYNISTRKRTEARVNWSAIATWNLVGKKYRTPNLAPIVQEIVQQSGWSSGNALAFIISGSGRRTVESYDGKPTVAPKLYIEFTAESIVTPAAITASVETEPVPHAQDAADDPAIWVHPDDPALSTVIGTDKLGGIAVYDLDGHVLQYRTDGRINNVDLRYDFLLGDQRVALVVATNQSHNNIEIYRVNVSTRTLVNVATRRIYSAVPLITGICMYHSPVDGRYYVIVNDSTRGDVEQWELFDNSIGEVDAKLVRAFSVGYQTEGCVADDEYANLYIASEDVGIWKYGAEPSDGTARTMIDRVDANGHLTADVEGLAIYYGPDGDGYLLASSQGSNEFVIYERVGGNQYLTTFSIAAGTLDQVTHTDGIDVANFALGADFPFGLFVAQDDDNDGANQNFKLVRWDLIATTVDPPLLIDPTYRSR